MHGRVGDSPIIGAGLCGDNEAGAATATGHGEEVINFAVLAFGGRINATKNLLNKRVKKQEENL